MNPRPPPNDPYEITGTDAEHLMDALGLTQKTFAEAIGVTSSTVSSWCTGRTAPDWRSKEAIYTLWQTVRDTETDRDDS